MERYSELLMPQPGGETHHVKAQTQNLRHFLSLLT